MLEPVVEFFWFVKFIEVPEPCNWLGLLSLASDNPNLNISIELLELSGAVVERCNKDCGLAVPIPTLPFSCTLNNSVPPESASVVSFLILKWSPVELPLLSIIIVTLSGPWSVIVSLVVYFNILLSSPKSNWAPFPPVPPCIRIFPSTCNNSSGLLVPIPTLPSLWIRILSVALVYPLLLPVLNTIPPSAILFAITNVLSSVTLLAWPIIVSFISPSCVNII